MYLPPPLYRIGTKRHGVLTIAELRRYGVSSDKVTRMVKAGALDRLHHGIYRIAGYPTSLEQRALAACLACGENAVTSHTTAAALWNLIDDRGRSEVTVPYGRRSTHKLITVHRSINLEPSDVTTHGVIPITRVRRTLIDLRSVLTEDEVERAFDEAIRRKLITPDKLLESPAELRRMAELRLGGAPEGEIERLAMKALARHGLPEPVPQFEVRLGSRTARIDLAYPQQRVAIELKGEAPHWGRDRWQNDHDRRLALERAGWTVREFTWWNVTDGELEFVLGVAAALDLVPTRWRSRAR